MIYARLDQAILWAAQLHSGQEREGEFPLPYITHPIEVLVNLRYTGNVDDEDLLIAAALHDTVEETNVTLAEIGDRFGQRVQSLVKELTRHEPSDEERAGLSKDDIWKLRSTLLLNEIAEMSRPAQQVKLADRLSNLREGRRTKRGAKLLRYIRQSEDLLRIVSREVNPGLWDSIRAEIDTI